MRNRIAAAAAGLAVLCAPMVAVGQPLEEIKQELVIVAEERQGQSQDARPAYEQRYLDVRDRYIDEFGVRAAGRDIVRDGYRERNGNVRPATRAEVVESTQRMRQELNPAQPAAVEPEAEAPVAAGAATAGGNLAATAQCESGGDYGAVNPAGYYGAYQFDQQTWDAYAPESYAGMNPAQAPPAVQDAAAASVDYNAWPNCPSP